MVHMYEGRSWVELSVRFEGNRLMLARPTAFLLIPTPLSPPPLLLYSPAFPCVPPAFPSRPLLAVEYSNCHWFATAPGPLPSSSSSALANN